MNVRGDCKAAKGSRKALEAFFLSRPKCGGLSAFCRQKPNRHNDLRANTELLTVGKCLLDFYKSINRRVCKKAVIRFFIDIAPSGMRP